jgi:hypothetical protein
MCVCVHLIAREYMYIYIAHTHVCICHLSSFLVILTEEGETFILAVRAHHLPE